ncbi:MAG: TetR family transcriptional regulator [Sneathiella sp.]|nr:TetR family transcriptional regulator [Sneathiella sp.]
MADNGWNEDKLGKEEQRQRKRMAVLRTGARLFNELGFDRTSLTDIADELNVSKRTLYYYVKNKDDILFQCSRLAMEFMADEIIKSKEATSPALHRIESLMRAYMDLLSNEFGACLVLCQDNVLSADCQKILRQERALLDHRVRDLINEGIKDGSVSPCNPRYATAALFGSFNWVPHWNKTGNTQSYKDVADQFLKIYIKGLSA